MQHDGGGWRCLVACRFAVTSRRRVLRRIAPPRIRLPAPMQADAVGRPRPAFVPPPNAWPHEPRAGNAGVAASHSIVRITCAKSRRHRR